MPPRPIRVSEAPVAVPHSYTFSGPGEIQIESITALFDGNTADEAFLPAIGIYTPDGVLLSRTFATRVEVGDRANVTFAPFLGRLGGASAQIPLLDVSEFPPASPYDGQVVAVTVQIQATWLVRFNASTGWWDFLGGGPALSGGGGGGTRTNAAYGDLSGGAGPTLLLELEGEYNFTLSAVAWNSVDNRVSRAALAFTGGTVLAASDSACVGVKTGPSVNDFGAYVAQLIPFYGIDAGTTVTVKYRSQGGGANTVEFGNVYVEALPVRIK